MRQKNTHSNDRTKYALLGCPLVSALALGITGFATPSETNIDNKVLASFDRDLKREAASGSPSVHDPIMDPLHTGINVGLWRHNDDQIVASFVREFNHQPISEIAPLKREVAEDPLHVLMNMALWERADDNSYLTYLQSR